MVLVVKKFRSQSHFGIRLVWPLIEAIHLCAGLARQGCRKKYDLERERKRGDFLSGTSHGLGGREGVNLPQAKVK